VSKIIKLRSEASGTVPELGSAPLNWVFTPLEAKQYSVDVPVLLKDNSVEVFTLQVWMIKCIAVDSCLGTFA
jgi:hypothetical protein